LKPARGWLWLALGLLLAGLWLGLRWWGADDAPAETVRLAPAPSVPASAVMPVPVAVAERAVTAVAASAAAPPPSDDLADHIPAGQTPTMKQVIDGLHQRGIRSGLAAFNPPGTRPPLIGLAVPEDFELPPGYVRHYQATDDGQRIEAILMYSPDLKRFDASGRELNLPADRVVPAELAPPGLPIRRIVIPPPLDPGKP